MSLLPAARVDLDAALSDPARAETLRRIKAVKGVISAAFNKSASAVSVTYTGRDVRREIEKIDGVRAFTPWRGY
jgi:hypothetical protein